MDNQPAAPRTRAKLSPEAIEKVRREWGPWSRTLTTLHDYAEAATDVAIAALEAGLPADVVAAMIRLRAGISSGYADNRSRVIWEIAHYERAIAIKPDYADAHVNLGRALGASTWHPA